MVARLSNIDEVRKALSESQGKRVEIEDDHTHTPCFSVQAAQVPNQSRMTRELFFTSNGIPRQRILRKFIVVGHVVSVETCPQNGPNVLARAAKQPKGVV